MFVSRLLVSGCAVFLLLSLAVPVRAVTVLNELFNSDSAFAKSNASGPSMFFRDEEDTDEYWGINDPTGNGDDYDGAPAPNSGWIPPYTGFSGRFLNGEDLNAQSEMEALRLDWADLNVSGLTSLVFSGLFAARGDFADGAADDGDYIKVQVRFDSDTGPFSDVLWFTPETAAGEPDRLRVDDNFDGIGTGTALGVAAQSFSAPIVGFGSTMDFRIKMVSDGDEELAFDTLSVTGTVAAGIPGDYNGNGRVDAADYVVWRKTDGTQAGYNTWRTNFGESIGGSGGAGGSFAVPEPSTLAIFIVAAAGFRLRRRLRT